MTNTDKKDKADMLERFNNMMRLGSYITFGFLSVFAVAICYSFINFSTAEHVEELKDVPVWWIMGFLALLSWYASKKEIRRRMNKRHRLPGEIFVYITWILFIVLPFCEMNGYFGVKRTPENLDWFFYIVTAIYAGSQLFKFIHLRELIPKEEKEDTKK